MMAHSQKLNCSFCLKSSQKVKRLIEGETGYICDACVEKCTEVLNTYEQEKGTPSAKVKASVPSPREIKAFLDQYVIGQEHTKEVLSVAVYNHYKRLDNPIIDGVEIDKSNILLCGPTGVGKTLLAHSIARMLDVPLAIADTTSLTEAGYVGDDVESIISRLLQAADYDVKRAERGIIFLDEIDKKRSRDAAGSSNRDVAGEGVQQALLKLLEGAEIMIPSGNRRGPGADTVKINTKNILFILGGAFIGLDKILDQEETGIGYGAKVDKTREKSADLFRRIEPEHLIKFGLIPELIGRVPVVTMLDELSEDELVRILTEPKNALVKQYSLMFALDGVELKFDNDALQAVAKLARTRKTNGRALRSVLETRLLRTQFDLPDMKARGISQIIVRATTIVDGTEPEMVYGTVGMKAL
jgi:ATP-dependent Clp protease ATP-binding subunit ClpX